MTDKSSDPPSRPSSASVDVSPARSSSTEVAIVGFGPVGAVLAGLLGQRGIDVVVVEREWDVYGLPRAAHIDHTGLRTLQELGLLDELLPTMIDNHGLDFFTAGDELLIRVPGNQSSLSGIPASMYFHQPDLDRRVRNAVMALPSVRVELGSEAVAIASHDDGGVVTVVGPDGSRADVEAQWIVGCDGSWSPIREWSGIELEDLEFEERWLVLDLVLREAVPAIGRGAICRCDPARPTYSIPMPSLRHRFEFMLMEHEDPSEMEERAAELVEPWLPRDAFEVERSAVYTFHGLVADRWRAGPALVAGDAAHQMPPFLGQGMCSGLRDAANLAWKLDAVLRHGAPTALLDTYGPERKEQVSGIIDAAITFGRIICTVDPQEAAARDARILADPVEASRRMRFALPRLPAGPLVLEGGGDLFVQPPGDASDRLDDAIGSRFAVFAREAAALTEAGGWWRDVIGAYVATLDELPLHADEIRRWLDRAAADAVIVRPDRYVMWAGRDLRAATTRVAALLVDTADNAEPVLEASPVGALDNQGG
jgi:3-(3-hydroxy-phenyl)propionate hydroxylase